MRRKSREIDCDAQQTTLKGHCRVWVGRQVRGGRPFVLDKKESTAELGLKKEGAFGQEPMSGGRDDHRNASAVCLLFVNVAFLHLHYSSSSPPPFARWSQVSGPRNNRGNWQPVRGHANIFCSCNITCRSAGQPVSTCGRGQESPLSMNLSIPHSIRCVTTLPAVTVSSAIIELQGA